LLPVRRRSRHPCRARRRAASRLGGRLSSFASVGAYRPVAISLTFDIGQGAGLSGATGVRPFLPPLLAGALARGDTGLDFDGTSYSFLESPGFLAAVFALAVLSYAVNRRRAAPPEGRDQFDLLLLVVALALGALLFAGSLAEGDHQGWPGLIAGVACAALGWIALGGLFRRARRRLDPAAAGLLPAWADIAALLLAGLAILFPPLGYVAIAAFVVLALLGQREQDRKYAGLRILR